ncbi:AMP-dependent acyl-CoA synthetase [Rhizobium rhizosphaerae]|uniref:AMP-dependent acyl-CoA synthetase n=2 Tax=Xaviernesmea rhizosphaerae TaxID=1672749 RepID=A0ABX3P7V4_9HYPH|nr:AMP-dependent acyl-CoA synthetase [Xaviernesmea rhizosphaerae]
MRLIDYLDTGASRGPDRPCLTMAGKDYSYEEVQTLSYRIGRKLADSGIAAGDKVAILSANDPVAFTCVFGLSRAGAVWCPINPRNEAGENRYILENFDCRFLIFHSAFADMVEKMLPDLPKLVQAVCLDADLPFARSLAMWLDSVEDSPFFRAPLDDVAMIPGTGGTTGKPKGVMLTDTNLEIMSALTLMGYPFEGRPRYLALAPLTHAAGVLCFPVLALGGQIVIMPHPDIGEFVRLIEAHRITHTFLPPTLIYMLLDSPYLEKADLSSLQCFWYGAAPISVARLKEALTRIGPMAQFFGQTEAPMMITMMAPVEHYHDDGSIAEERLRSAGRAGPLVRLGIMDGEGRLLPAGERGEVVLRSSLVMKGYYNNPGATEEAFAHGWHHTGDIGYLDGDNFLYIVDRARDMIITGGFNVYSVEVEQALAQHDDVLDCAVVGLPDDKWGERIVAVVQPKEGRSIDAPALIAFVKTQIGSIKAPKQLEVWPDLPRSRVGKVLKAEIRVKLTQ